MLFRSGDEAFAEAGASEAVLALWRPRFLRAARWFLDYESERRKLLSSSLVERAASLKIPAREPFTLTGRADRIDLFPDGSAAILDYKTGRAPTKKQIESLIAPQLPLEAAMLLAGAFADCHAKSVRELVHIRLTGGETPGEALVAQLDANAVAAKALDRLKEQIARYNDQAQAYRSRVAPLYVTDEGDYDHLSRVREWMRAEEDE